MKIGVLGTGNVATTLATGLLSAGHEIVFGSRDPKGKSGLLPAPVTTLEDAVAPDLVINAMPGGVALDVLKSIGPETLAGKILVDVANALTAQWELLYPNDSLGARIQDALPGTRVVKTLNTISAPVMTAPKSLPTATSIFLSGNDKSAKHEVSRLLTDLGWAQDTQLDLGDITTARATEHYLFLSLALMTATGTTTYNISVVR